VLTSRSLEIADLRERGARRRYRRRDRRRRPAAAGRGSQLASVHRVLFAESTGRMLAGESRDAIFEVLAAAAPGAFDLLEPSLGGYGVRADTGVPAGAPQAPGAARAAPLPD
jgi:hypothetical protein